MSARRSLPLHLTLNFFALVILIAFITGLPAIWMVRQQLNNQAWQQVEQGLHTTHALIDAEQSELSHLAKLVANRPTLRSLILDTKTAPLEDYLNKLRMDANLDVITLCQAGQSAVTSSASIPPTDICEEDLHDGFQLSQDGRIWQTASHVPGAEYQVVLGREITPDVLRQFKEKTGLHHILTISNEPVASSFGEGTSHQLIKRKSIPSPAEDQLERYRFEVEGQPFFAAHLHLGEPNMGIDIALPIDSIIATERRLVLILGGGLLVITGLGALVGVLLARRTSKRINALAAAAARFSQGDLTSSVSAEGQIIEEIVLAQALENARVNLLSILTELEHEKDWTNQLLDAIVEGIVTLDNQNRITFFSRGAERITGWKKEEVLGRFCDDVFHLAESNTTFSRLIPSPAMQSKVVVEMADGHLASLSITSARLPADEGDESEIALVFRDASSEEIIHQLLGQFIANITHEFRTPLAALAASIELLIDQAPDLSPEEFEELLTSLHLGIISLQTLVDNLLETASIEAGHFRVSPHEYDLGKIIHEAIDMMHPLLDKYGQQVTLHLPETLPRVQADPRRSVQVIVNLLSNASKYGPPDAEITILAEVDSGFVRVSVSDRGPGISPDIRGDLFRRLVYPNPEISNVRVGAGLGLSVVKAIVEAQGGQTGVIDRPGEGTTFWFTIPVAR